jgi:aminomethyltransferase
MRLGGQPITDYAPDHWLISTSEDGDPVGYVTSPWFSPELDSNIAMGFVPLAATEIGTELWVHLPEEYADTPGVPVRAEVCEVPFRASVNPNQREILKKKGLEAAI